MNEANNVIILTQKNIFNKQKPVIYILYKK